MPADDPLDKPSAALLSFPVHCCLSIYRSISFRRCEKTKIRISYSIIAVFYGFATRVCGIFQGSYKISRFIPSVFEFCVYIISFLNFADPVFFKNSLHNTRKDTYKML